MEDLKELTDEQIVSVIYNSEREKLFRRKIDLRYYQIKCIEDPKNNEWSKLKGETDRVVKGQEQICNIAKDLLKEVRKN